MTTKEFRFIGFNINNVNPDDYQEETRWWVSIDIDKDEKEIEIELFWMPPLTSPNVDHAIKIGEPRNPQMLQEAIASSLEDGFYLNSFEDSFEDYEGYLVDYINENIPILKGWKAWLEIVSDEVWHLKDAIENISSKKDWLEEKEWLLYEHPIASQLLKHNNKKVETIMLLESLGKEYVANEQLTELIIPDTLEIIKSSKNIFESLEEILKLIKELS